MKREDNNIQFTKMADDFNYKNDFLDNQNYLVYLRDKDKDVKKSMQSDHKMMSIHVQQGSTDTVTQLQKRKHQITFLAANAKENKKQTSHTILTGKEIKKQASNKYGW